ncbi:restriction endonuclease subunit S [Bacillus mycoides]|uniref:Restriction endonuclease subunit S n=1 Tax=Bacillus mycoides TaxID=1405 RepID=A0AAP8KU58_BACMY|nr:restriction endonuclease subunit S [Bacillus mycoides]PJN67777.1 hypothetical protein BAWEI_07390 [Bacillus mycoides]PJN70220.1 hypothetical protein BACWE_32610 [Bacillus mycoides]
MSNYNPVLDSIKLSLDCQFLKLKYFCEVKDGTHDTPAYVDAKENTYPLVTSKDIDSGVVSFENAKHISEADYLAINRRSNVEKYDVIMPMIGTIGNPAIIDTDEKFSIKNVALFKINGDLIKAKYLKYLLSSEIVQKQINLLNRGGVQSFVSLGVLGNISITMSDDINKIVSYLDVKASAIDELISSKERLIQLLEEKRQSMITEAVTKGLNPNVKMKDSGVEWIGEIPENWTIKKIKHISTFVGSGKTPKGGSEIYPESGVLFLRSMNVHYDGIRLKDIVHITPEIDEEMRSTRVKSKDVLLNITGASIGRSCIVPESLGKANVNQHVCIIRSNPRVVVPELLSKIMSSNFIMQQILMSQNGSSREGLNFTQVKNLEFPLAKDLNEQIEIANHISVETDKVNSLINMLKQQIQKLKDYRQSLIYEAVTGKIDVRDFFK